MKICLTIIFNHRYDANLPRLREIYAERFECIRFLMPFYDGTDSDVIPVYECSYQFQGYLIQAYDKLMATGADYFFFAADDVLISPKVNQNNMLSLFRMESKEVFLYQCFMVNGRNMFDWIHTKFSSKAFIHKSTSWKGSIPDKSDAISLFEEFFDTEYPERYSDDFWGKGTKEEIDEFIIRNGNTTDIPYPMAGGYSDIFIISRNRLFDISRTCGIFAAMNLFVEIAIPTSIVLNVKRDQVVDMSQTGYRSDIYWYDDVEKFENKYQYDLKKLQSEWKDDCLLVHPVKLSKWK